MSDHPKIIDQLRQIVLIRTLRNDYDHAFLTVEGAKHFSAPFGFEATVYEQTANPTDPKGLTLNDGSESAVGIAADDLAFQIARHLDMTLPSFAMGRGHRLRVACDLIEANLRTLIPPLTCTKLPEAAKSLWIKALRSKDYLQGQHSLRQDVTLGTSNRIVQAYCCLGVYADVANGPWMRDTNEPIAAPNRYTCAAKGMGVQYLLESIMDMRAQVILAQLNDGDIDPPDDYKEDEQVTAFLRAVDEDDEGCIDPWSFEQIADFIEVYL